VTAAFEPAARRQDSCAADDADSALGRLQALAAARRRPALQKWLQASTMACASARRAGGTDASAG
jgi:hypothetical protein